jgi:glycosyltransferase involved in cell wall biosynthesis
VSLEDWDEIWRRNQFLCAILSRRRRILFVGPPRTVRERDFRWTVPVHPGVTFFRPWKVLPNRWTSGRRINEWLHRFQLRLLCRTLGMSRPTLWINDHAQGHLAGRLGEAGVVYDVTDDWTVFPQQEEDRRRTVAQDAALTRRADAVIVCSDALYAQKDGRCRSLHLIPNGVDLAHYERVSDASRARPSDAVWPSPAVGYTGTVHAARVDLELLEALAQALPSVSIVLIGPSHLAPGRLQRYPNIFLAGPRPYEVLPEYMRTFDACIVPHLMTPFTESLNPIKLWEYLAAGLPVVSTDVAGFRDYPDLVRLTRTPAEFVAQVRAALDEGDRHQAARRAVAAHNSWELRAGQVSAILAQVGGS